LGLQLREGHDPIHQALRLAAERPACDRNDAGVFGRQEQAFEDLRSDPATGAGQPDDFPDIFRHALKLSIPP
jgi:hypothetical protein